MARGWLLVHWGRRIKKGTGGRVGVRRGMKWALGKANNKLGCCDIEKISNNDIETKKYR